MTSSPERLSFSTQPVAIVTGAASGIGRAAAAAFASNGIRTVLSDISAFEGEQLAVNLEQTYGTPCLFVKCDVAEPEEVRQLVREAVHQFGRLDYAFNNAGTEGTPATTANCSLENWNHVIATNLTGVWHCMKYEIEEMLKCGGGSIVNCSSVAGLVGFPNVPAYTASKHGVVGLTKTAALEYAKLKIRVNAVCPGVISTPMITRFTAGDPAAAAQLAAGEPVGRLGLPDEVAEAVLWLCSDRASFVTGQALAVDGGWVAQ